MFRCNRSLHSVTITNDIYHELISTLSTSIRVEFRMYFGKTRYGLFEDVCAFRIRVYWTVWAYPPIFFPNTRCMEGHCERNASGCPIILLISKILRAFEILHAGTNNKPLSSVMFGEISGLGSGYLRCERICRREWQKWHKKLVTTFLRWHFL